MCSVREIHYVHYPAEGHGDCGKPVYKEKEQNALGIRQDRFSAQSLPNFVMLGKSSDFLGFSSFAK